MEELLRAFLEGASGGNNRFNAAERAALPDGILRTAAEVVGSPCTTAKIVAEVMIVVDARLREVGLDTNTLATDPGQAISIDHVIRLALLDPMTAGLLADAMAEFREPRVDVAGLPPPTFMIIVPGQPTDPSLTGPELTGVPGADGVVRLIDPARVDALVPVLHALVDAMDASRDGTITLGEAKSFLTRANHGAFWDPQVPVENRPRTVERVLYDVREAVYQRTRRSPTTSEVKEELARYVARAKEIGADWHGGSFDASGPVDLVADIDALILFEAAREPPLNLHNEPYVRFFDHEGDEAVAKRRPLDLSGPAATAIRNLVFHFNKAGNDNHWPLWSGRSTSRYRLDAEETANVVERIRSEPPARRAELFQAMVDWLSWQGNTPGILYVNVEGRHLIDALAVELGHSYRSPTTEQTAPRLPPL